MNRVSLKKSIMITLALTLMISSCQLNSNEKRNETTGATSESIKENEGLEPDENETFTPSHTTVIKLVKREDGGFEIPIEINYRDPNGKIWKAPAGTVTDGASIPTFFADFFGGKLNREYLFASIIHDAYCAAANAGGPFYHAESWEDTHHMFYSACIDNGTGLIKASAMYVAVRLGGPRWSFRDERSTTLAGVSDSIPLEEMKKYKDWIVSKGETLTPEQIDKWTDERSVKTSYLAENH